MKLDEIYIRDPFILNDNGKYYLYGTRGEEYVGKYTGLDVFMSDDLENWSKPKVCFTPPDDFWGTVDAWAPEVHKYNGKYYCFVSFKSETRTRATHILVSDSPEGPFVPNSTEPVTPREWECLDGTLYVDDDSNPYMIFCHEWSQIRIGEICAVRLDKNLKKAVGNPIVLLKADAPSWADGIDMPIGRAFVTDGPFVYRGESGKLLMLWSSFAEGNYVEAVASSDNGEITGKWTTSEKLLFEKDGGHGMLFKSNDNRLMFVMHFPNIFTKERPLINEVDLKSFEI